MAKAGNVGNITTKTSGTKKDFSGSGVEGQKEPDADKSPLPFCFSVLSNTDALSQNASGAPSVALTEQIEGKSVITCEDVLKTLRAKGHKI